MHAPYAFVDARMPTTAVPLPLQLDTAGAGGRIQIPATRVSVWLQLRGSARVSSVEGQFRLDAGDWIALDRGSSPIVEGERGLAIGLSLGADLMHGVLDGTERGLLTGRGHLGARERRAILRLWRACAVAQGGDPAAGMRTLRPLLRAWERAQDGFAPMIDRCPGRSFHRKARIFCRIQKARLYLEAHPERMLRIDELMELTRFSSWWLSKTFHAVYQETLQKASMRLRMQRARALLQDNRLSIGELADACGFHDPCSFARQFKAWHGVTASAWRAGMLRGPRQALLEEAG